MPANMSAETYYTIVSFKQEPDVFFPNIDNMGWSGWEKFGNLTTPDDN